MLEEAALGASILCFALVCSTYFCNLLSDPRSWLRADVLSMILVSLLTGLFPFALAAALTGLWAAATEGLSGGAILDAGTDLAALGFVVATALVFRALVRETARRAREPAVVTPLTPAPRGDAPRPPHAKLAA